MNNDREEQWPLYDIFSKPTNPRKILTPDEWYLRNVKQLKRAAVGFCRTTATRSLDDIAAALVDLHVFEDKREAVEFVPRLNNVGLIRDSDAYTELFFESTNDKDYLKITDSYTALGDYVSLNC